jgi:hypothetical protein
VEVTVKNAARVTMLALSFTLVAVIAWKQPATPAVASHAVEPPDDMDAPECPGPYFAVYMKRQNGTTIEHEVEIAGHITKVAEFHDCQRFVTGQRYEALYAVFASDTLDSLFVADTVRETAYAVAEVYTKHGDYGLLGIRQGFNCLYLSNANGWEAFMVWAGNNDDDCGPVLSNFQRNNTAAMKKLTVKRVQVPQMSFADYPPTTRWDRAKDGQYSIGVKCGAAWCEIGLAPTSQASDALPVANGMTHGQKRVRLIKGWYDQQTLAVGGPTVSVPGGALIDIKPAMGSDKVSAVMPVPRLGSMPFPVGQWRRVGTILMGAIPGYESKLGVKPGTNKIELRRNSETDPTDWSARVVDPNNSSHEFEVTRRDHSAEHFNIPGTLRWRWQADDETIWVRCLEGCCQVQQTGGGGEGFGPLPLPHAGASPTLETLMGGGASVRVFRQIRDNHR